MNPHGHLTEDELDDLLIGIGSAEAEAHVGLCAACAARRAEFTDAMRGFNQATLAWSEAKSNTLTRDLMTSQQGSMPGSAVAGGGLCTLAVAVALLTPHLPSRNESNQAPQAQTAPADRDREIAGDNAMLQAIDAALYRPEPSPEQVYRLSPPSNRSRHATEVRE